MLADVSLKGKDGTTLQSLYSDTQGRIVALVGQARYFEVTVKNVVSEVHVLSADGKLVHQWTVNFHAHSIVSDREVMDTTDVFKCFKATDGKEAWEYRYPAFSRLDFGNSLRVTPLIHDGMVFVYGAQGQIACLELTTGKVVWGWIAAISSVRTTSENGERVLRPS